MPPDSGPARPLPVDTLGIPALICVDADPGGIQVALTYAQYINNRVREELATLVDRGIKAELEAVSVDMSRFVDEYLPHKIFDCDLVKL
jgi:DNA topoisomerase VI subunit A